MTRRLRKRAARSNILYFSKARPRRVWRSNWLYPLSGLDNLDYPHRLLLIAAIRDGAEKYRYRELTPDGACLFEEYFRESRTFRIHAIPKLLGVGEACGLSLVSRSVCFARELPSDSPVGVQIQRRVAGEFEFGAHQHLRAGHAWQDARLNTELPSVDFRTGDVVVPTGAAAGLADSVLIDRWHRRGEPRDRLEYLRRYKASPVFRARCERMERARAIVARAREGVG